MASLKFNNFDTEESILGQLNSSTRNVDGPIANVYADVDDGRMAGQAANLDGTL